MAGRYVVNHTNVSHPTRHRYATTRFVYLFSFLLYGVGFRTVAAASFRVCRRSVVRRRRLACSVAANAGLVTGLACPGDKVR